ncbi:hypothetical protein GCM10020256_15860 [Streptomyces thermocoprophilus]
MHAAVARLIEIVPPGSPRRTRDWNGVERVLGTQLPEDYKELVEVYGGRRLRQDGMAVRPALP